MDFGDQGLLEQERDLNRAIHQAPMRAQGMEGASHCLRCGEPNDRRQQGYGVCTDCVEDVG